MGFLETRRAAREAKRQEERLAGFVGQAAAVGGGFRTAIGARSILEHMAMDPRSTVVGATADSIVVTPLMSKDPSKTVTVSVWDAGDHRLVQLTLGNLGRVGNTLDVSGLAPAHHLMGWVATQDAMWMAVPSG
jgi:hypothetical protein